MWDLRQRFIDGFLRGWKAGGGPLPTGMQALPKTKREVKREEKQREASKNQLPPEIAALLNSSSPTMSTQDLKKVIAAGVRVGVQPRK